MSLFSLSESIWSAADLASILSYKDILIGTNEDYKDVKQIQEDDMPITEYSPLLFADLNNVKSKKKKPMPAQMFAAAPVASKAIARKGMQYAEQLEVYSELQSTDLYKLSESICLGKPLNSDGLEILSEFFNNYESSKNAVSNSQSISNGRLSWLMLGGDATRDWVKNLTPIENYSTVTNNNSNSIKVKEVQLQAFSETDERTMLQTPILIQLFTSPASVGTAKIPVGVLGTWEHPVYGTVTNTQEDFDEMKQNWSENVTGYEPPLFVGHPLSTDVLEGAPAVAFLSALYQEGETLYGEYEFVDDEVYADVEKGKYRYSSPELIRNAKSKNDGSVIGTLLVGCALTNRPFLTGMPQVEVIQQFSESNNSILTIPITTMTDTKDNITIVAPSKEDESAVVQKFSELAQTIEAVKTELEATKVALAAEKAKNDSKDQIFSELHEQLKADRLNAKLSKIDKLALDAGTKQKYSELITASSLSAEDETKIMDILNTLSEKNKEVFSEQRGYVAVQAPTPEDESNSPYKDIIARNKQVYAQRTSGQVL